MEKININKALPPWLLILPLLVITSAAAAGQAGPVEMLREVTAQLIDIAASRPEILDNPLELRKVANEVVLPHVDFAMLSRQLLGKYWRNATAVQQQAFANEFRELLLGSYLRSVSAYKDNSIRFLPLRADPQPDYVLVNAFVEQKNGPQVRVDFRLHRPDGEWLIFDVIVEGVSLVTTHRSTFSGIIHNQGIDSLIEQLRERNAINARERAGGR